MFQARDKHRVMGGTEKGAGRREQKKEVDGEGTLCLLEREYSYKLEQIPTPRVQHC